MVALASFAGAGCFRGTCGMGRLICSCGFVAALGLFWAGLPRVLDLKSSKATSLPQGCRKAFFCFGWTRYLSWRKVKHILKFSCSRNCTATETMGSRPVSPGIFLKKTSATFTAPQDFKKPIQKLPGYKPMLALLARNSGSEMIQICGNSRTKASHSSLSFKRDVKELIRSGSESLDVSKTSTMVADTDSFSYFSTCFCVPTLRPSGNSPLIATTTSLAFTAASMRSRQSSNRINVSLKPSEFRRISSTSATGILYGFTTETS
mmetsp:Transcript_30826/g.49626  ORF Transcript_30826/g.49626 Transcript_30826/m.49626 type:complete len:263 (-) Transcript_30826:465-1253(-)